MTYPAVVHCALGEQADQIIRLSDALDESMTMLRELEWLESADGGRVCAWCGCTEELGHAERCGLRGALDTYYRRA